MAEDALMASAVDETTFARPELIRPRGWRRVASFLASWMLAGFAGGGAADVGRTNLSEWAGVILSVLVFVLVFALCSSALDQLLARRKSD